MSRTPELPQTPEYLDPREAAEWLPYEFYFSQQDGGIMDFFYEYVKHQRPNLRYSRSQDIEIKRLTMKKIQTILKSGKHVILGPGSDAKQINDQLDAVFEGYESIFNTPDQLGDFSKYDVFLDQMTLKLLRRDYEYLIKKNGRPSTGPLKDKWMSQIVHYAIHAGKVISPGGDPAFEFAGFPPIYQKMFKEIRERLKIIYQLKPEKRNIDQRNIMKLLNEILEVYNLHHPNSPSSLDDLLKE